MLAQYLAQHDEEYKQAGVLMEKTRGRRRLMFLYAANLSRARCKDVSDVRGK
jgi:hypothetical protein